MINIKQIMEWRLQIGRGPGRGGWGGFRACWNPAVAQVRMGVKDVPEGSEAQQQT